MIAPKLPVDIILGADFLCKSKAVIDMLEFKVTFPYGTGLSMAIGPWNENEADSETHQWKLGDNLTNDQIQQISKLIERFPETVTKKVGRTHLIEYDIKLKSDKIVRARPYQFAPPKLNKLREHIQDLLDKGIIKPSDSPYSSPGFLIPKKGTDKFRFVVNYKAINNSLELESTPVATVEAAFQYLGKAKWFSLIDLNSAYLQIPLTERSKKYTNFVVPFGSFSYEVIPFGLATGSQVLTRLLDKILGSLKYVYVFNFYDDIIVFSDGSFQDHVNKLEEVFTRLRGAGLTVNPGKMTIASNRVEFLGHIFSNGTVSFDPERIRPIIELPPPKNVKQVSRLVGLMAYYARYIPHFATLCAPLNQLKRKNVPFRWGQEQIEALNAIKAALTSHPILRLPDFEKPFILQTDGSGTGLGAQLGQEHEGIVLPVAYASRPLNKHELNKATLELECSAVVFGLQKFQQYLEHRPFKLLTDSSSLSWLLNHPRQVGKIARWIAFINSFQFTSEHIRGDINHIPDLLSRMYEESEPTEVRMKGTPLQRSDRLTSEDSEHSKFKLTTPTVNILTKIPEAFKDIAEHQRDDPELNKIIRNPKRNQAYTVNHGVLMYQAANVRSARIVLPDKLTDMIFKYYHVGPSSAHLGIRKTLHQINRFFWAPNLNKTITDKIKSCIHCQRAKPAQNSRVGKLSSEIVTRPFEKDRKSVV